MIVGRGNGGRHRANQKHKRLTTYFASLVLAGAGLVMTSGCATSGGPGFQSGGDSVNSSYFDGVEDFKTRVGTLRLGMTEAEVFAELGVEKDRFFKLSRKQVTTTLFAGAQTQLSGNVAELEAARKFFNSLSGYRLNYRDVKEETGLTFAGVKKTSIGYDMSVTLIFKDGVLYDTPEISGGPVHQKKSKTYLKILTGTVPLPM